MKLKNWALVAEIVGAAAVVISLVYVGIQVRDSARAVSAAAVNDAQVSTQAWYLQVGTNRQTSEVWLRGILSMEPLTTDDEFQYLMIMHAAFLAFQNSYLLNQEGALDDGVLRAITAALRGVKDLPGLQRYWAQRKSFFHENFVEYIEDLMAQPASDLGDSVYTDALNEQ